MAGLQARRDAQTRDDIVAAALALFHDKGFGPTTMEDIAQAAGVSRRTVYRRFPTKDHIVIQVPTRWLTVWDDAVAERPEAPPLVVAEAGCLAVARYIDAHRTDVLTAYTALAESPTLAAAAATANQEWIDRVVALLRREAARLPGSTPYLIAGAYLGAIDAMMIQWVTRDGRGSVLRQTKALLNRLRPIWPSA
jgi:AcrR family transcriptional regulator